ncbi:hypothetical protein CMV_017819 [Castanea mollissima]|uniref:Uncharacterized protein n=1 Tax=Castanea mollissima TaxID=60419 RepID=A0A8J4QQJ0_9ROSI|nr:hypothetical protein CMV_017819 [Castanea mollissima]
MLFTLLVVIERLVNSFADGVRARLLSLSSVDWSSVIYWHSNFNFSVFFFSSVGCRHVKFYAWNQPGLLMIYIFGFPELELDFPFLPFICSVIRSI